MNLGEGDTLFAIARNAEENADEVDEQSDGAESQIVSSRQRATRLSPTRHNATATASSGWVGDQRSRGDLTERAGRPQTGDGPDGDGPVERAGARHGAPPHRGPRPRGRGSTTWQRGAARPQRPGGPTERPVAEHSDHRARPAGVDARLNRFISGDRGAGGRAAGACQKRRSRDDPRRDVARPEAYASELPDLSGPVPRAPHAAPARAAPERDPGGGRRRRPKPEPREPR